MLNPLFSWLSKGEEVIFSGVERPEESRGSQFQPSPEIHLISWAMAFQSPLVRPLWTLELGERGW